MHIIKHFIQITAHRFKVMHMCFQCGLYWRGITHDLSKYSKTEFLEGAKYYVGKYSPISECKRITGKSDAWLHHKGRNAHHPEYWIDKEGPVLLPYSYAVESICDQLAIRKNYKQKKFLKSDPLKYWYDRINFVTVHEKTAKFFEHVLTDLARNGENYILNKKYMKETYKKICKKNLQKNYKHKH